MGQVKRQEIRWAAYVKHPTRGTFLGNVLFQTREQAEEFYTKKTAEYFREMGEMAYSRGWAISQVAPVRVQIPMPARLVADDLVDEVLMSRQIASENEPERCLLA